MEISMVNDMNGRDLILGSNGDEYFENEIMTSRAFAELMTYYKCAMMEITTKFNVLNEEFSLQTDRQPISAIKSRLKSPSSIIKKMKRYYFPLSVESIEKNLNDIAGVRVVCSFVGDVYYLVEALTKQDDIKVLRIKDYIKYPKANGYRSFHLIVEIPIYLQNYVKVMKAEVQFRTIAMDAWASLEHQLRYKKDIDFTEEMAKELIVCANLSSELDRKMNDLQYIVLKDIY